MEIHNLPSMAVWYGKVGEWNEDTFEPYELLGHPKMKENTHFALMLYSFSIDERAGIKLPNLL